jgi:hypothetical protein
MTDVDANERCIALTQRGERCSRVAKDGEFCFQHDESYDTIDVQRSDDAGLVNWLSSELESRAATVSDIQRDVYMNLADMQEGVQTMVDDFKSGDIGLNTLLSNFEEVAVEVGGERSRNTAAGAVIGGIAGAPLGPAGIYAGIVTGSSVSFFMSPKDDRAVVGFLIEEPPEDAEIIPSNHSALSDVTPIQLVVESTVENEDDDWIRETNTRSWDMNAVEDALSSIPEYEADEAPPGVYYIQDIETGKIVVLVFGTPDKDFPES